MTGRVNMAKILDALGKVVDAARLTYRVDASCPEGYVLVKWDDVEALSNAVTALDDLNRSEG